MCPKSGRPEGRGHGFPKTCRLLKRGQFLAMSDRSTQPDLKVRAGGFLVVGRANELDHSRLGVTVTKKTGTAVTRNLIKRLVRELFRLNRHRWPGGLDLVFIARPEAGIKSRTGLAEDLALAGRKIAAWSWPVTSDGVDSRGKKGEAATRPEPGRAVRASSPPRRSMASMGHKPEQTLEQSPELPTQKDDPGAVEPSGDLFSFWLAIPGRLALGLIFCYQRFISPLLPPACRFWPTCSNYAAKAIKVHGFWRGSYLTARRLLKCHPFHPGGYDPVPPRKEKAEADLTGP